MDMDVTDDIEMEERNEQEDTDQQEADEEETSFIDDDRMNDSILVTDRSDPIFVRPDYVDDGMGETTNTYTNPLKETVIQNNKQFLKDGLGISTNERDGPNSAALYDDLIVTKDKNNRINGAKYKGKKILIVKDGKMEYSKDRSKESYVNEFKELLMNAHIEHSNTPSSMVEDHIGIDITQDTMDSITDNVTDRIRSNIDDMVENIERNTEITENELRELRGILNVKGTSGEAKLKALEIEIKNWRDKAEEEGDTAKGKLYEAISEVAELKAEEIRLILGQKPEGEEVTEMVKDEAEVNDLTRYERFKVWCRNNLLVLTSVALTVGSIIVTVVMATRNTLNKGGNALDELAKAIAEKIKKLAKKLGENIGPIVSAIGSIITGILSILAKMLEFVAGNLWMLFLAVTYFIYNEYKSRRETRAYRQT